jgi:hypothetical protein
MSRKKILLKKALMQAARGSGNTHTGAKPAINGTHAQAITPRNAGERFNNRIRPLAKG